MFILTSFEAANLRIIPDIYAAMAIFLQIHTASYLFCLSLQVTEDKTSDIVEKLKYLYIIR